jgi:hypothetical protein
MNEDHGAMLEFFADDAVRGQPQSVSVKRQGSLEVIHSQGNDPNARSHLCSSLQKRLTHGQPRLAAADRCGVGDLYHRR